MLARWLIALALLGAAACRPVTAPYDPRVHIDVTNSSNANATKDIVPEAELELPPERVPRVHRAPLTSEVWIDPDGVPRGIKTR